MANEAKIIEKYGNQGDVVQMTCAEATTIPYGTILELTDEDTAIKVSGAGVAIAGICAAEFVGGQGKTKVSVFTNVKAELTCGAAGTAVIGEYVRSAGSDNTITVATTLDHETGKTIGKSLATGSNNEAIAVRMRGAI